MITVLMFVPTDTTFIPTDWTFVIGFGSLVLMKIVCFILGYLIIRLGYRLISSGIRGEFNFSAKLAGIRADLASMSPGLLFVLLGTFVIAFAVWVDKPLKREPVSINPNSIDHGKPPVPSDEESRRADSSILVEENNDE